MTRFTCNTLATLAVLIFTALPLSAAEVVTYYHNDHLGSPIAATDSSGTVVWQQAYDPWGVKVTTNTDERGYTGNWLDEETGLADHKARWYTSSIGRFTGIDPVKWQESNIHSFNRYAYASNNPYRYIDTDGRNAVAAFGGLIVESYNFATGRGFDGSMVLGALADGYNGEGAGFARSLYQDAESFVPIGAVAGALVKSARLAKGVVARGLKVDAKTVLSGGRSGSKVKNLVGPPNSAVRGGGQRAFVTNDKGEVILDITKDRVKPVTPGQGFGPKRAPTQEDLDILQKVLEGGS